MARRAQDDSQRLRACRACRACLTILVIHVSHTDLQWFLGHQLVGGQLRGGATPAAHVGCDLLQRGDLGAGGLHHGNDTSTAGRLLDARCSDCTWPSLYADTPSDSPAVSTASAASAESVASAARTNSNACFSRRIC